MKYCKTALLILLTTTFCWGQQSYLLLKVDSYKIKQEYDSIIFLAECSEEPKLLIHKAEAYYNKQDFKNALYTYIKINNEDNRKANFQISKCYSQLGYVDSAIWFLNLYMNSKNKELRSVVKADNAYLNIENDSAWQQFWLTAKYSKYELLLNDAYFEYKSGYLNSAIEILDEVTAKRKSMHKAYKMYADIYIELGDFKNSLYYSKKASDVKPRIAEYHYLQAISLLNLSRYKKAKSSIDQTMRLDSSKVKYYILRGRIESSLKNFDNAKNDFELLKKIYSSDSLLYLSAVNNYNSGDFFACLKEINLCININSNKLYYYKLRAETYFKTETYRFAINDYEYISNYEPSNYSNYSQIAQCYLKMNNYNKACLYWQKADKYGYLKAGEYILRYCK